MGMALLRGLQLRNSQETDCGTGQALTPSQRGWHGQNMPQNIDIYMFMWKRFRLLVRGRMETFLISAHPLSHGAPFWEELEQNQLIDKWVKRNRAEVTRAFGLSQMSLSAHGSDDVDLICGNRASRLKHLRGTVFLRRKSIPGS